MVLSIELLFLGVLCVILVRFNQYKSKHVTTGEKPHGFSLVIPFRNEEKNLYRLLESLSLQRISIPYEVILINDGSEDNSENEIQRAKETFPHLQVECIPNTYSFKKALSSKQQAIDCGVMHAQFDWLIFTDADMQFNSGWLHTLYESTNTESGRFVFGRTAIIENKTLFSRFQSLQLSFLFGNAWFLALARIDSSCMGNNVAIEKRLYTAIGGQEAIGYSIVEDKKLLSVVRKRGVAPIPSKHFYAFAKTAPSETLSEFLHQMIRWLKGGMQESLTLSFLISFFLLHIFASIWLYLTPSPSYLPYVVSGINWLTLLGIFNYIFLKMKLGTKLWQLYLYLLLIPFEALLLLPATLFIKPKWKGRVLSKK